MPEIKPEDLTSLAAQQKFKPYYFLENLIGRKKLEQFYLDTLAKAPNPYPVFDKNDKLIALGCWNDSPWDTRNTGYKTARLNFLQATGISFEEQVKNCETAYLRIENELQSRGYEYILFRVNTSDLPPVAATQNCGFHVVDGLQTLMIRIKAISQKGECPQTIEVRKARDEDIMDAKQIAYTSFIFDRFHSDPAIPDETANQLHANWVGDSYAKNDDEGILAAVENGRVLGFLTYSINKKTGDALGHKIFTIILVATHPDTRNRGLAKLLIQESLKMARDEGFEVILVGTQLRNIRATRLYQKMNFLMVDSSYTLRKILHPKSV